MGRIANDTSNYVEYILDSPNAKPLKISEPLGWKTDDFELNRNMDYHGVFTSFVNNLAFSGEALEYIVLAYKIGGINTNLTIVRRELIDVDDEVKMVNRYFAYADFNTMSIKNDKLSIKFNSDNLAELLKSHETDEFDVERDDDIDGNPLPPMIDTRCEIKGRELTEYGQSKLKLLEGQTESPTFIAGDSHSPSEGLVENVIITPTTELTSIGPRNHASVDSYRYNSLTSGLYKLTSSNFFYVRSLSQDDGVTNTLIVNYDCKGYKTVGSTDKNLQIVITLYERDDDDWIKIEDRELVNDSNSTFDISGEETINVAWNQGVLIRYKTSNGFCAFVVQSQDLIVNLESFYEPSLNIRFLFVSDLMQRLLSIVTGKTNDFHSKYLGRIEDGYIEDGEGGLIGVLSGWWVRAFPSDAQNYKSVAMSIQDCLKSIQSEFALGVGIEKIGFDERLRVEPLKYFYQPQTAFKLPSVISNVERVVDSSLFFSGSEIGYERGGDYGNTMGLDEPNSRSYHVTPVRKSKNKFKRVSKISADEYGMEITRRKSYEFYPNEDTRRDESNWFVDLKRTEGNAFSQVDPLDRLEELPTGVFSPTTFRSAFFTPLRMMFRNGFIMSAGLQSYKDKFVKFISSDSNNTLRTHFKGEAKAYTENEDILVSELDRPRFSPEIVKFTHEVTPEVLRLLEGTTRIEVGGVAENVPNVYFKIAYTNENGEIERGYLLSVKTGGKGEWEIQLSNEN